MSFRRWASLAAVGLLSATAAESQSLPRVRIDTELGSIDAIEADSIRAAPTAISMARAGPDTARDQFFTGASRVEGRRAEIL